MIVYIKQLKMVMVDYFSTLRTTLCRKTLLARGVWGGDQAFGALINCHAAMVTLRLVRM
jgi:hypothetical protein